MPIITNTNNNNTNNNKNNGLTKYINNTTVTY